MLLNKRESFSIAVSSTAPMYSVIVTAPLIIELMGGAAPWAYVLAAIPALLVCYGMVVNDRDNPSKGTVYSWVSNRTLGWLSGFALAVTGVIATSGLAYVAAEIIAKFMNMDNMMVKIILAGFLMGLALFSNIKSVKVTSMVQGLGIILHIAIIVALIIILATHQWNLPDSTWNANALIHGILLATFAYWGFDAAFALTEETEKGIPQITSMASIVTLVGFFAVTTFAIMAVGLDVIADHPLVAIGVMFSAIMSLGSTMIPTVRGIEKMSENGDLSASLSRPNVSDVFVFLTAWAWTAITIINVGFFNDSIEALSIFVGFYFVMSSLAAFARSKSYIHLLGALLMGIITIWTAVETVAPDYGETEFFGVGGVFLIAMGICTLGAVLYFLSRSQKRAIHQSA